MTSGSQQKGSEEGAIFRAHSVTRLPDVAHGLAEVFSWFILAANHILFLLSVHYVAW